MPKVKVISHFIGQPDEHEQFGGQIPAAFKDKEKKMSDAERNSYSHLITTGTTIDVSDKRAKELAGLGLVEYKGFEKEEQKPTGGVKATDKKANEKVSDIQVKEKNHTAGPNDKK